MNRLSILAALVLLGGCARPYLKVAPSVDAEAPLSTLMVSAMVENNNSEESKVDAIAGMAQGARLDDFGETLVPRLTDALAPYGIALNEDAARAKELQNIDMTEFSNKVGVLSGSWSDPDGMIYPVYPESLFKKMLYTRVAKRLDSDMTPEGFAYISARLTTYTKFFVVKYPVMQLTVLVSDDQGQEVMRMRTWGKGLNNAFAVNRSPESLGKALDEAIEQISTLEPEEL